MRVGSKPFIEVNDDERAALTDKDFGHACRWTER
jgi:hypothetical protein